MKQDYWDQILWEAARRDPDYQTLLAQCRELEAPYLALLESLSPQQRELLERYISLCEELEHQMTILACRIPRE